MLVKKPDVDDGVFLSASNYDTVRIQRLQGPGYAAPATFGVLDFEGLIEVTDPRLLLSRLADGFGKAKAFGCRAYAHPAGLSGGEAAPFIPLRPIPMRDRASIVFLQYGELDVFDSAFVLVDRTAFASKFRSAGLLA